MLKSVINKTSFILLSLTIVFFLSFIISQQILDRNYSKDREGVVLSDQFDSQGFKMSMIGDKLENIVNNLPQNYWSVLDSLFHKNNFICIVTSADTASYWNSNDVSVNFINKLKLKKGVHVVNLPSGWYLYTARTINDHKIYLLDLIRSDFQVNNDLLLTTLNQEYTLNDLSELTTDQNKSSHKIYNKENEFIVGIKSASDKINNNNFDYFIFSLFILTYAFLSLFIINQTYNLKITSKNPQVGFSIFLIIILSIHTLEYYFQFPKGLKESQIFSNDIYELPFITSAGDLLISTILILLIAIGAYRYFGNSKQPLSPTKIIIRYTVLWIFILAILFVLYHTVYDQNISFFSENIFKNEEFFISLIVIIGLNISLYYTFITYLNSYNENKTPFIIPYFIIFAGIFIFYIVSGFQVNLLLLTLTISFILITIKQFLWKYLTDFFLNHLIILVILATVSSIIVSDGYKVKNDNYQVFIAQTMAVTNDALFEYSYETVIKEIQSDQYLKGLVFNDTASTDIELAEYIRNEYFKGYLNKYDIQVTNCGYNELLEIQPEGIIYNCEDYFSSLIYESTIPAIDSFLYRFNTGTESIYYISRISLKSPYNHNMERNIFIEFVSSHVPEGLGYPELLIDKRSYNLNLSDYSFAIYSNNRLTYKFGDYAYNTYNSGSHDFSDNTFFEVNDYRHFAIPMEGDNHIVVSRQNTRTTMKIVVFSIIFILLSLISIIIYIIVYAKKAVYLFRLSFKTRLQTFVIATLTLVFILMSVTTLFYIEDSTREDLEKQLNEKTSSVLIELQHKLKAVTELESQDSEFLHQLLRKFSLVFFSDINLYNKAGELIATSRPEIFEKSLLSSYINPKAYNAIFIENKLNFITEEKIGALKYYSSYVPISLNNDYPIGIVNLPYFARQTEFTKSYYIMLSYLINIYVIIGIIGTLIAIIFSRYLTRPLVLLQESLATIRIDKHNEKIIWHKNDEIGLLINEYNRMVDKLEQSAGLLVRSERESAWREVAKQIAHEIKNPLTPMKLNVQYLEKSYKNNDPDFSSKIKSISQSLITQIETLNNVAEMFSDFAKEKSLDLAEVHLGEVISSSVNLFNKNSDITISVNIEDSQKKLITLGFEKDILRVINNILKNAIQSLNQNEKGEIKIDVKQDSEFITVAISDNGKGISEDMQSKIFQPYFTTKTSGTGLGLAIVKNIMNEIGGEVNFKSDAQNGTTFFLIFPNAT